MKHFFKNNGLSVVLSVLFLCFWAAQSIAGMRVYNDEQTLHGSPSVSYKEYLLSGHFWQATGENWESEFLQMGFYVIWTTYLFQRGSAESNDPDEAAELARKRREKRGTWRHRNSLSLAFLALFGAAFYIHAIGGLKEENQERAEHSEAPVTLSDFLTGSEFWFQSFQNWQSEFLAVLSIVVLSIFLRQSGSPESKEVEDPNSKTGS